MRISDWSSVVCSSYLGEVEVRIAVAIMGADIADEAQMLRPLRVARQQRAFVVARNALRKDRVADRDPVIVAIAVDQFVPRPACADMVDDHLAAILYGEAVLRPAMGDRKSTRLNSSH